MSMHLISLINPHLMIYKPYLSQRRSSVPAKLHSSCHPFINTSSLSSSSSSIRASNPGPVQAFCPLCGFLCHHSKLSSLIIRSHHGPRYSSHFARIFIILVCSCGSAFAHIMGFRMLLPSLSSPARNPVGPPLYFDAPYPFSCLAPPLSTRPLALSAVVAPPPTRSIHPAPRASGPIRPAAHASASSAPPARVPGSVRQAPRPPASALSAFRASATLVFSPVCSPAR